MPLDHSLLIVENDASLLDLLTRNFIQRGYAVTPCSYPRRALEAATIRSFDVALLDGSLPEHDGIWLMRALKAHSAELEVIILSAHTDEAFQTRCVESGAFAYLRKPCSLAELETTVEAAIERRAGTDTTDDGKPTAPKSTATWG